MLIIPGLKVADADPAPMTPAEETRCFQPAKLNTFLGLAQFLQLGKRPVGGIAALFLGRINQLSQMTPVKNRNAIFDAGVLPAGVAGIRTYAHHIALVLTGGPKRRIPDVRTADVGWIIERVGHRAQNFVLVVRWKNIGIFLRLLFAA